MTGRFVIRDRDDAPGFTLSVHGEVIAEADDWDGTMAYIRDFPEEIARQRARIADLEEAEKRAVKAAVLAAVPLEAMIAAGTDKLHEGSVKDAIYEGVNAVRALMVSRARAVLEKGKT